jgi:hypothetical protein
MSLSVKEKTALIAAAWAGVTRLFALNPIRLAHFESATAPFTSLKV